MPSCAARAERLVQAVTGADPRTVKGALAEAQGEVKDSYHMLRLSVSADAARERLKEAVGRLRIVLGEG